MRKISILAALAAIAVGGLFAQAAEFKGIKPLFVQAAFYTPTYQCIYLKGGEEMGLKYDMNAWNEYKTVVNKKTVAYDGMGGKFKNFNVIRIKSNTEKSKQEVVVYIDNVTLRDGKGNVVKVFDFEDGDPAGVYVSMGKPLAKNGTVVEIDGKKCFLLHMQSESMYGYNGVEVQWTLPENKKDKTWDFTKEEYTVSFDYYVSVAQ